MRYITLVLGIPATFHILPECLQCIIVTTCVSLTTAIDEEHHSCRCDFLTMLCYHMYLYKGTVSQALDSGSWHLLMLLTSYIAAQHQDPTCWHI